MNDQLFFIKMKIEQTLFKIGEFLRKKFRGYSNSDVYNVDIAITDEIMTLLPRFIREIESSDMKPIPSDLERAILEEHRLTCNPIDDEEEMAVEHWLNNLEIILRGFSYKSDDFYDGYLHEMDFVEYHEEMQNRGEVYKRAKILFCKYFDHLWI